MASFRQRHPGPMLWPVLVKSGFRAHRAWALGFRADRVWALEFRAPAPGLDLRFKY